MIEAWLAFLTGLAGSGHCIGMCGGIAAAVALHDSGQRLGERIMFNICYSLGRVATYGLLGVIAGFVGAAFDASALRDASRWCFAAANLMVVMTGILYLSGISSPAGVTAGGGAAAMISRPLRLALNAPRYPRAFCSGMLLGFLPCGLVYAVLASATAIGSVGRAVGIMAALGAGTAPALLLVTAVPGRAKLRESRLLRVAVGWGLVLLGGAGLWRLLARLGHLPLHPFS